MKVELYDTTLRDGAQRADLSYTVEDRLRILHRLDEAGFPFVEGGWPGANPRDTEFLRVAARQTLRNSTLVAFGMTRRAGEKAEDSGVLRDMLEADTEFVCLVGKSWDLHVTETLRTDLAEGVAMVADSISFLAKQGRRTFFDAEHFFDGYRANASFALDTLKAAEDAGAERLVLCDTNGGTLPGEISRTMAEVAKGVRTPLGIHAHNDTGCGVANSLVAAEAGAFQIQGTVNGYGERCGNANIVTIAADLELKMDCECLSEGAIGRLTDLSHFVAEVANVVPEAHQPFVGRYAFAHKAGLHTAGVSRITEAYEHIPPESVGNRRHIAISDLAGKATLQMKAEELGLELGDPLVPALLATVKDKEALGYTFEAADATLELLMRRAMGWHQPWFEIESFRVTVDKWEGAGTLAEATVKVQAAAERHIATAEGEGPVGALDTAFRKALGSIYPELDHIELTDYRVRVLDTKQGTGAVVRVLIDSSNGEQDWTTIGVSENIIEASWEALTDAFIFGLLHPREQKG